MFPETRKLVQLVLTFPITSKEGEKNFSLMKRILYYTRYARTMYVDLTTLLSCPTLKHPSKLSKLSTEKIIEMFVQANPRNLKYK